MCLVTTCDAQTVSECTLLSISLTKKATSHRIFLTVPLEHIREANVVACLRKKNLKRAVKL